MSCVLYAYGTGHLRETLLRAAEARGMEVEMRDPGEADLIFVAQDVLDHHASGPGTGMGEAWADFCQAMEHRLHGDVPVVVLSQVPPGWTRVSVAERPNVFYQADTIIVRRAVERMVRPEQFIIGCADPGEPLPLAYQAYLAAHEAPVLQMSYESAEMAKCAVNYLLAAQVQTSAFLSRVAERCGADWGDVARALRGDARIGAHAYLRPGRINQHLRRDVDTLNDLGKAGATVMRDPD